MNSLDQLLLATIISLVLALFFIIVAVRVRRNRNISMLYDVVKTFAVLFVVLGSIGMFRFLT